MKPYEITGSKVPFAPRDTDGISRRYSVTLCLILILVPAAAAAAVIFSDDIRIPLIWLLAAPSAVSLVSSVIMMTAARLREGGRLYAASRLYLTFGKVFSLIYAAVEIILSAFVLTVSVVFAWAVRKIGEYTAAAIEAVKQNEFILKIAEADKLHVIEKLLRKLIYFLQSLIPEEGREAVATASKIIEHINWIAAGFVVAAFLLLAVAGFFSVVRHLLYGDLRKRIRRLFSGYYTYERRKIRFLAAEFRREERDRRRGRHRNPAEISGPTGVANDAGAEDGGAKEAEKSTQTATQTATQTEAQTADASAGGPAEIRASEKDDALRPAAEEAAVSQASVSRVSATPAGELFAGSAPDTAEDMLSDAFEGTLEGAVEIGASEGAGDGQPSSGTLEGIAPEVPDRKREREERRAKRKEKRARRRSVKSKVILGLGLAGFVCRAALLFFISPWLTAVGALQGLAVAVFALMIRRFEKMKTASEADETASGQAN
ncbi:MAG: hypothetical protein J6V48_09280 [Clostridia bacterium]|nr:hypothetical protein [Clostridia bacterium]